MDLDELLLQNVGNFIVGVGFGLDLSLLRVGQVLRDLYASVDMLMVVA